MADHPYCTHCDHEYDEHYTTHGGGLGCAGSDIGDTGGHEACRCSGYANPSRTTTERPTPAGYGVVHIGGARCFFPLGGV